METQRTCKERVGENLKGRLDDLRILFDLYQQDADASHPDLGQFSDYGLGFDYVAPGTFTGQRWGYFRYQLSWGGPSDEFRFYCDERLSLVRAEYWLMDWGDGAKKTVTKNKLVQEIFDFFKEIGSLTAAQKASEA